MADWHFGVPADIIWSIRDAILASKLMLFLVKNLPKLVGQSMGPRPDFIHGRRGMQYSILQKSDHSRFLSGGGAMRTLTTSAAQRLVYSVLVLLNPLLTASVNFIYH